MTSAFAPPSGSRVVDLVNTVDWRDDPARRIELIPTARALADWVRYVRSPANVARGIRHEHQRARMVRLRETLAILLRAIAEDRPLPAGEAAALTRWIRQAWHHRELVERRGGRTWQWRASTAPGDALVFELALDAGALLLSPAAKRLRICANHGCGWFFIDHSNAGRRRWCSMATCGNRTKVRAYRQRAAHD
jgi:predicted RNA-binding Zn ribbon-like protein